MYWGISDERASFIKLRFDPNYKTFFNALHQKYQSNK